MDTDHLNKFGALIAQLHNLAVDKENSKYRTKMLAVAGDLEFLISGDVRHLRVVREQQRSVH
jgi:hypothetical protein